MVTLLQQLCWLFKTDNPKVANMFTSTPIERLLHPEQIWSGIIIISFVIYHVLHYTVRFANDYDSSAYIDPNGNHDVYKMLIDGFSWWPASLFYIFSMALLCWHLSHGFASVFQTLGLRTDKTWAIIKATGYAYSLIIFVGNCSIPFSVLAGWLS